MKTKEKEISLNRIILPLVFIGFSICMEIVNYLYLGFRSVNGSLMVVPTYFMIDLAIIFMIGGLIFLCQNKVLQNIVFYFFVFIHVVLNIINTTMYYVFGDILSYDLLFLGGEATASLSVDLIDWWGVVINLLFLALTIVAGILLKKYNKKTFVFKYKSRLAIVLAVFILCQSLGASAIALQVNHLSTASAEERTIETSDEYLWENFQFKLDAYKKFGHFGFYAKSIVDVVENLVINEDHADVSAQIDEGYQEENEDALLYGDNLVVVLCESLEWYGIDPVLTPTLYSLAYGKDENAVSFSSFYGRNRTNISEGISLLGSMPRNTLLYNSFASGQSFDYSLPKLFKSTATDKCTKTQYLHENYSSFYKRNVTHGINGIGFDEIYDWKDYTGDCKFSWGDKLVEEYEFSSNLIDNMFPTDCDRFLTYYATISTHGSWTDQQENLKKYYPLIKDNWDELIGYTETICEGVTQNIENDSELGKMFMHYKAGIIDLDRTVKMWLEELEERCLKENTTILFFADHNTYMQNMCYRIKGVKKTDFSNIDINNIPMFIYSPHLASEVGNGMNDVYCNTYDILPTICDLFGLPTNSTLFQGYSIYSDEIENSFFSSNLNGMFTQNIYSLNIKDIYTQNGVVSQEEIEKFKQNANRFYEKQEIIEIIYSNGINGNRKLI